MKILENPLNKISDDIPGGSAGFMPLNGLSHYLKPAK
jgi:hypothetical protein